MIQRQVHTLRIPVMATARRVSWYTPATNIRFASMRIYRQLKPIFSSRALLPRRSVQHISSAARSTNRNRRRSGLRQSIDPDLRRIGFANGKSRCDRLVPCRATQSGRRIPIQVGCPSRGPEALHHSLCIRRACPLAYWRS